MSGLLAVLLSWYNGAVGAPVERFATAQVCLLSGLVVLVPWGWRAQLFVSAAAMLSMMLATPPGAEAEGIAYAGLAGITGGRTSGDGAFFPDRYRHAPFSCSL